MTTEPKDPRTVLSTTACVPSDAYVPPENLARLDTHPLRPHGQPRINPPDYTISLRTKFGTDQQLLHPGPRRQSLRGFEDHYADIIDFIVRATHFVWEEKNVGYIYEFYGSRSKVMDDTGMLWGRERVVAGTLQALNAYPDFRGHADEIIWAGDDEVGFSTSHRAVIKGTNTGYSQHGEPTFRKVQYWLIADCWTIANEICEEWVLYNNSSHLQQLGFDVKAKARELGSQVNWASVLDQHFGEVDRLLGQNKPEHMRPPTGTGFDVGDFLRRMYHYVWNWRMLGKVRDAYAPNLRFFGPSDRQGYGRGEYQSFLISLMSMFPDMVHTIDDIYWMGNDQDGYTTSTRWSVVGTHTGPGVYGKPTGRRVYMWGITQHYIKDGRITEEWMMFNEFEVMQQIMRE
jgi:hypothetical protein